MGTLPSLSVVPPSELIEPASSDDVVPASSATTSHVVPGFTVTLVIAVSPERVDIVSVAAAVASPASSARKNAVAYRAYSACRAVLATPPHTVPQSVRDRFSPSQWVESTTWKRTSDPAAVFA